MLQFITHPQRDGNGSVSPSRPPIKYYPKDSGGVLSKKLQKNLLQYDRFFLWYDEKPS